jgi:hypothetical protein
VNLEFDRTSQELEIQLRELRRLVADFVVLPDEIETRIDALTRDWGRTSGGVSAGLRSAILVWEATGISDQPVARASGGRNGYGPVVAGRNERETRWQ